MGRRVVASRAPRASVTEPGPLADCARLLIAHRAALADSSVSDGSLAAPSIGCAALRALSPRDARSRRRVHFPRVVRARHGAAARRAVAPRASFPAWDASDDSSAARALVRNSRRTRRCDARAGSPRDDERDRARGATLDRAARRRWPICARFCSVTRSTRFAITPTGRRASIGGQRFPSHRPRR